MEQALPSDREAALDLAREMDGLPLALYQAGAYIEETGCGLAQYLKLYQQRRTTLLKRQSSVFADYPSTVGNTWSLSFKQIEQESLAAAELLRLCAYLAPDAIPEILFKSVMAIGGAVLLLFFVASLLGISFGGDD